MKRLYLVTGAAGFLGGTICRQLIDRGEEVRAFVLPNDTTRSYRETIHDEIKWLKETGKIK